MLIFEIPAITVAIVIFIHIALNRANRSKIKNHGWLILIIVNLFQLLIDLPMPMSYYYLETVWPAFYQYCIWWTWCEFSVNAIGLFLMTWISIERHVIIFQPNTILQKPWKKWMFHFIPLILCLIYTPTLYFVLIVISPYCNTLWDFNYISCGSPCYFTTNFLGHFRSGNPVPDSKKYEVRRWRIGDSYGTVVAGGHGQGNGLDQLNSPCYIFVDKDYSVYISDEKNHCVMKWTKGATEGIIVAGGQGQGNGLAQLSCPRGVIADQLGTVYVADCDNNRVMCWSKETKQGIIVVGGNNEGKQSNQLSYPQDLSFDRQYKLYVVDYGNHRIQRFNIDSSFS
ncbi:unnamed protein product [Rotaria sp. Silwood1]|nr:unnamed protein product [Rotaria sp. Silwood1]CAF1587041.1 unnamed protein product [Rotaria sp. Silwood1]CAF3650624.1 unnamed protein product [Rotaria sp. Silwood1]